MNSQSQAMPMRPGLYRAENNIGKRLITLIIAFSSLLTFFITALQLFLDYREQRSDLDTILNQVTVNLPSISGSVWAYDQKQIDLALEALINLRNIERATIITTDKKRNWVAGGAISNHVVTRSYPLIYQKRGQDLEIGSLEVIASLDAIYEKVLSKAVGILISNGVKTFFVAMFMFFIFYKFVTSRIQVLAMNVGALDEQLQLSGSSKKPTPTKRNKKMDEIDIVQQIFDGMADKLRSTITALKDSNHQLQHAYEEVRTINEELEARVEERTEHLRQEVAQRAIAQESLHRSQERLRDIAESASDWFWEMGPDFRFTFMSDRCYEVTGLSPGDIIGKTRLDIAGEELPEEEQSNWDQYQSILEARKPLKNFQYRWNTTDGRQIHIKLSGLPFWSHDGTFLGYRGAAQNITDMVSHQEELNTAKLEADLANQAKSGFISSMSHELRTPLNGILGFAQLLELHPKFKLNEQQLDYVAQIRHAGDHLLTLINDILDLSKIEAGKVQLSMEAVSPIQVVESNLELLKPFADRNQVSLVADLSDYDPSNTVYADSTRLSQIIMNLCSNAIKYNREGGEVSIRLETTPEKKMRLSVSDTGIGIPENQLNMLFVPFNRLGAEGSAIEGTGVGLSITQRLVGLMNGEIRVKSDVGKGTVFEVEFPLMATQGPTTWPSADTPNGTKLNVPFGELAACRVLYIEDNLENLDLTEEIFQLFPQAELITATTGEESPKKKNRTLFCSTSICRA